MIRESAGTRARARQLAHGQRIHNLYLENCMTSRFKLCFTIISPSITIIGILFSIKATLFEKKSPFNLLIENFLKISKKKMFSSYS